MPHQPIISRALGYRGPQVLAFIRNRIETEGSAPTYGEIMRELDLCDRASAYRIVERLEKRGLLSRVRQERVRRVRLVA
jgi:DNA-binding MarR family transcriptional regulator